VEETAVHKIRTYVDTSVFGGVLDDEFSDASAAFFSHVERGRYIVLISEITLGELSKAPHRVQDALTNLSPEAVVKISRNVEDEARKLADAYIAAGILGKASQGDAAHVAVATVARADLILSWNFRHIVNYERINAFNGLNSRNGYPRIAIHSPLEMRHDDEDQDV
jgi:predicted nucleic acid-binding protein